MLEKLKTLSVENLLLLLGVVLLSIAGGAWVHRVAASRSALWRFQARELGSAPNGLRQVHDPASIALVDFSLWSPKRVQEFKDSLAAEHTNTPVAVLRIPKIHLEVPVFNDTDDLTLNRGVGRILGTAQIGQLGNLGLAGHRDGFFRGLKDVSAGDAIELVLPGRTLTYVTDAIQIVNPDDVSVLRSTRNATLTLVTCYPFYFIGSAPQRYIVSATIKNWNGPNGTTLQSVPFVQKITSKEE
jgi:sortase A